MISQELPADVLSREEYLVARFRMAGHYPHVRALADHAFRWAAKQNSKDLMVYVLKHGAPVDINALLSSVEVKGNPVAIELLKKKRAATDPWHTITYPLHIACFYGQLGSIDDLLGNTRSRNISKILRSKDHRGETALHKAIGGRGERKDRQRVDLVYKLLSLGADPIQRDMYGRTALLLARDWDHNEMIPALKAASKGMDYPVPILEEAFSELDVMESPADTTEASSSDDEVSSLKSISNLRVEVGDDWSTVEKVDGQKQSRGRFPVRPTFSSKPLPSLSKHGPRGGPLSRREGDIVPAFAL